LFAFFPQIQSLIFVKLKISFYPYAFDPIIRVDRFSMKSVQTCATTTALATPASVIALPDLLELLVTNM
jgi:hypothetical protein